jgi:hypothetical protein
MHHDYGNQGSIIGPVVSSKLIRSKLGIIDFDRWLILVGAFNRGIGSIGMDDGTNRRSNQ